MLRQGRGASSAKRRLEIEIGVMMLLRRVCSIYDNYGKSGGVYGWSTRRSPAPQGVGPAASRFTGP